MGSAVSRSLPAAPVTGAEWTITRLPSALDSASRTAQRRRPWLTASEEASLESAWDDAMIERLRALGYLGPE